MDESMGLLSLHVSDSILFHLDEFLNPRAMWLKFDSLFGRVNEIQAFQIEAELVSLSPNSFPTIEDFLNKFKTT